MANTLDELLIQGQEALATVVEAMQEDWMAIPEAYDGSISVDKSRYRNPHFVILNVNVGGKVTRMNVTIDEGLATKGRLPGWIDLHTRRIPAGQHYWQKACAWFWQARSRVFTEEIKAFFIHAKTNFTAEYDLLRRNHLTIYGIV